MLLPDALGDDDVVQVFLDTLEDLVSTVIWNVGVSECYAVRVFPVSDEEEQGEGLPEFEKYRF